MNIEDIKCSDCKYWLSRPNATVALCRMSKVGNPMMRSGCGLQTHKDFGCKLFEPKPSVITTPKSPPQDLTNFNE